MRPLLLLLLSGCAIPACPHWPQLTETFHVVADDTERLGGLAPSGGGHVEPPADQDEPDGPPADDDGGPDRDKSNASANNGKGGNYDRTGHTDNGKGKGRGR